MAAPGSRLKSGPLRHLAGVIVFGTVACQEPATSPTAAEPATTAPVLRAFAGAAADSVYSAVALHSARLGDSTMLASILRSESLSLGPLRIDPNHSALAVEADSVYLSGETSVLLHVHESGGGHGNAAALTYWNGSEGRHYLRITGNTFEGTSWFVPPVYAATFSRAQSLQETPSMYRYRTPVEITNLPRTCGLSLSAETQHQATSLSGANTIYSTSFGGTAGIPACAPPEEEECSDDDDGPTDPDNPPPDQLRGTDSYVPVIGQMSSLCSEPGGGGGGGGGSGGYYVTITSCWGYDYYVGGVYAYSVVLGCSEQVIYIQNAT